MIVNIPKLSGFCPGVQKAEKEILRLREQHPKKNIYILGYLINNRNYIKYLSRYNIITLENTDNLVKNSILVIRTHGISTNLEAELKKKFNLIDLTCPKVKKVQLTISKFSNKEYFIIITGKKNHPETIGLVSCSKDSFIIETLKDLDYFIEYGYNITDSFTKNKGILIISQTTGSREIFDQVVQRVTEKWTDKNLLIKKIDSICAVTDRKEKEALKLQENADISFIVGDRLSSNANKLFKTLKAIDKNVYFIEDLKELKSLNLSLEKYNRSLVVSSASTPLFIEKEVCDYLTKSCP